MVYFYIDCDGEKKAACLGIFTIYRESFTLAIFYSLMAIGSISGGKGALTINRIIYSESCWTLKILFVIALFILTFFIPNSFFVRIIKEVYREIARYFSIVYLLLQVFVIIDFGYSWSDS